MRTWSPRLSAQARAEQTGGHAKTRENFCPGLRMYVGPSKLTGTSCRGEAGDFSNVENFLECVEAPTEPGSPE